MGMPLFYLHIRQGDGCILEDPDGTDAPDIGAARATAIEGVRDLLAAGIKRGDDGVLDEAIVITDEAGQELMSIPFIEALPPRLRKALSS
jgi:hypothetical protein